jgi:hypothetical protein
MLPRDLDELLRSTTADARVTSVMSPLSRIIAALEPFAPRDLVQGLREIVASVRRVADEQRRMRRQS